MKRHWSILGSGVSALCVAKTLHAHGERIELIESPTHPAASYYAGGMLAPYCEAEAAPHLAVEQAVAALAWWQKHSQHVVQKGTLVIAPPRDRLELQRFAKRTQQHQWVKAGELEADLTHVAEGLFFPSEAHLNPRQVLDELKTTLKNDGVPVHSKKPTGKIIDCRGIFAQDQLPTLRAVRGEMLILQQPEIKIQRPIRLLHPRFPCYLVPRGNGVFMLGATMIESANTATISVRSTMELLSAVYSIHPAFAEATIVETGVGLRPAYSNNIPKLHYEHERFYINGMHRHGFLYGPILAQHMMDIIQGKTYESVYEWQKN